MFIDENHHWQFTQNLIFLSQEMMSSYGYQPPTSTPTSTHTDSEKQESYNPPLPALPTNSDSSSESSSDDEEDYEDGRAKNETRRKGRKNSKANIIEKDIKTTDSNAEGGENRRSYGTDSPSDHSINRLSFGETMASDEASEPRVERSGSLQRKRTSTVLSNVSLESTGSNPDVAQKEQV